ncbi:MAG TPA: hypothetical protein VGN93_30795 [Shinella sp.]|uniref:hypothetical protein n=1 Tax=Shinella TaxID=323620 RepID=UPI0007DA8B80|nr:MULTISPECIES: hypothetical protein [Shinella]CAI0341907.1 conserved hypothetical protein [Rhizobiaceae bacterium]CAK7262365.1 protein of unknown function [Shinella sp. WSC3-e]ANH09039.1 hypothetical protein shn_33475 [Shinella sp. HZN7]MDC7260353.1 hypothetical protein [Shinella sp. YE25]HEV7251386.1 hypothetical protein [Shinella sp.]
MKTCTIETMYRGPNYRQGTHSADTVEDACRLAIADEDWTGALPDSDNAGETYVIKAWERADAAYSGPAGDAPEVFSEMAYHKAELFEELVALLQEPAQPWASRSRNSGPECPAP